MWLTRIIFMRGPRAPRVELAVLWPCLCAVRCALWREQRDRSMCGVCSDVEQRPERSITVHASIKASGITIRRIIERLSRLSLFEASGGLISGQELKRDA